LEGENLKTSKKIFIALAAALFFGGCGQPVENKDRVLLTVDFEQSKVLRYKFISSRQIEISLKDKTAANKEQKSRYNESLETIIAYKPVKVEPYGLSIIEATCESVRTSQITTRNKPKEATENLAGKSFKLTVGPTGKIEDRKELEQLLKEAGGTAFRPNSQYGRIKEPELLSDFMATQVFLWDSISSIKEPQKGVAVGDKWQSQLSIPSPMPLLIGAARDVVYKLEDINETAAGRIAIISSEYSISKTYLKDWFVPYTGSFQLSGPFGLYGNCRIVELKGKGRELFNIDAGKSIGYSQDYQMKVVAVMSLIPITPEITIKQHLSMQLIEEPKSKNR
jgi:hypothetical protein